MATELHLPPFLSSPTPTVHLKQSLRQTSLHLLPSFISSVLFALPPLPLKQEKKTAKPNEMFAGRSPPAAPLQDQVPSFRQESAPRTDLDPHSYRNERGSHHHHEPTPPGNRTIPTHPCHERAQPPPPPPSSSSSCFHPNQYSRAQPSTAYRDPAAVLSGHAPSSYQPSGQHSSAFQPPPLPFAHHQHPHPPSSSASSFNQPSHLTHHPYNPVYAPPLLSSSATTSLESTPYEGGAGSSYSVGDFQHPPLPPPPPQSQPSPPFPTHLRTTSYPSSNSSDREMAYVSSRPPSAELGGREGPGGGGVRPGLFLERRAYSGEDEGAEPVAVGGERRGEPRSQQEHEMMVQNQHHQDLQDEEERYGRSGPPSPYYYAASSSSSYSGTYPPHQQPPPQPHHNPLAYHQPPSASTSASSSPYPSHHQGYAPPPPPPSWSQSPYGPPPPHHSTNLPTPHPSHPHLLGRQPMQLHQYGLPSPLQDQHHPTTISPTTFSRPLIAQHSHSNSTTSSHVDTQSPYASYHSHSGGSSAYEEHDDELAPYSSPNQWQTSPPLEQQGGAVGWVNSAGPGGGMVGGRQPYMQGGGRMGYAGEGSGGGLVGGGEPMRRPSQIVKMGGKAKKGSKAVGAGVAPGVDGRGKGEDNWIGGQKTRRQVKNACTTCQKLHKPCDEQRPCARCTKRGPKFAEECRDSDRKPKKGMPRSRVRAGRTSGSGPSGGEVMKPLMTAAAGFVEGERGGGLVLESNASSSSAAMSRRAGLRGALVHSPDDEASKSRKPSEDSSYASSIQHSRSSTSSSSSSGFPMLHQPYGIRRPSGLVYQNVDPVDHGGVMVVDRENDGMEDHEEMGIRGWHAEEKEEIERRDQHQHYAYPAYRPRSPFPLQAPVAYHPFHEREAAHRPYHQPQPPHPQPSGAHLPPQHHNGYRSSYPPPPHPHYPPPHHQPALFNPPPSSQSFNLERPPQPVPRVGRQGPPPSLVHLPFRTHRVEDGMSDPPPSPRGDLPTPEVYKRSPKAKSPLGVVDVEAKKDPSPSSSLSPPSLSLGADAVQEGSPSAAEVIVVVPAAAVEEEKEVEEGRKEEMVGVEGP